MHEPADRPDRPEPVSYTVYGTSAGEHPCARCAGLIPAWTDTVSHAAGRGPASWYHPACWDPARQA